MSRIKGWRKTGDYRYEHVSKEGDKVVITRVEIRTQNVFPYDTIEASYFIFQTRPRYIELEKDILFTVVGESTFNNVPTKETISIARRKLMRWMRAHPR